MAIGDSLQCSACGGTDLCFGYQGTASNVFVPTGIFMFHGYKTRSFVCLDCGRIGSFISRGTLEKLRNKLKHRYE